MPLRKPFMSIRRKVGAAILVIVALPALGALSWLQKLKQLDNAVIGIGEHAAEIEGLIAQAEAAGRPRNLDALRSQQVQLEEELAKADRWLVEVAADEEREVPE